MTMTRDEKRDAEQYTKGVEVLAFASPKNRQMCREQGRGHYNMTPVEYGREYLGRRVGVNAETATARKMERMGWVMIDRVGFRKLTRRR